MNIPLMTMRKQRGLTQAKLGERAGLEYGPVAIRLIEIHDWVPPMRARHRIAKILHVPEDALFGDALRSR